jgi:hypothetical protein
MHKGAFYIFTLLIYSCVSINLEKDSTKALEGLPQYWLTSSLYAHEYPDDKKLILLDFEAESASIIPAGTLVQLIALKPQVGIYLKVAQQRGQVNIFYEKTHLLVIPKNIKNKDDLKIYLARFMSKKDPHPWLLRSRAYIQDAIWAKKPVIGMNKRELSAALGPPHKSKEQKNPDTGAKQEIWYYEHYFVLVDNNEVTKVKKIS